MTRVLAILVDALRCDYVNEKDTPYIHSLAEQGHKLPLRSILGYSDAIRATIFTGAYPDRHGYWMSYCYSPETSPFKALKSLSFIDYIPSDFIRRAIKFILSSIVLRLLAKVRGYPTLHLHNIPFRIIDRFDMTMRKRMTDPGAFQGYPTIFDALRAHGMKFAYLDSSSLKRRLLREVGKLDEETMFVFVYLHYIDEASHWFGLKSSQFKGSLRAVDSIVQQIVRILKGKFGDSLAIVLFSDHGMAEERNRVDLSWLTRIDGFGRDFLLSLDATMVRVWYERAGRREELRRLISEAGSCRLLSEEERKELRVAFKNRLYGDDIFLFDEGHIIFPNFYSYVRPRAMHAYDPSCPSQRGIFILDDHRGRAEKKANVADLVSIAPTLLTLLRIPFPATFQGKPLAE